MDGKTVCRLHGGGVNKETGKGSGAPLTHGRRAKVRHVRLAELIEQFTADDDPLNLIVDLATMRALMTDFIDRYEEYSDALIAWHESFSNPEGRTPKPTRILDITAAAGLLAQIGSLVARIEKSRETGAISMASMDNIIEQMGAVLVGAAQETIEDNDTRTKLLDTVETRWSGIRIADPRNPGQRP